MSWSAPPYARGARLWVGGITRAMRSRDVEDAFVRYGPLREINIKEVFAFIEYVDARDAEACVRDASAGRGPVVHGERLRVEYAKDRSADLRGSHIDRSRALRCYQCGQEGHMSAKSVIDMHRAALSDTARC